MKPVSYFADLFLTPRFFWGIGICAALFGVSFYFTTLYQIALLCTVFFFIVVVLDYGLLFFRKKIVDAQRYVEVRLSNGDDNLVQLHLHNLSNMRLHAQVIDELPVQFQRRDFDMRATLPGYKDQRLSYQVRPVERGEYLFGNILLYVNSPLALVLRRCTAQYVQRVKVYPSFLQLHKQQLVGVTNDKQVGASKLPRFAHSLEFDHIKDYTNGDDIRTINWKATARRGAMMVNTYTDERSQQIYAVLDMGRIMKMPFNNMTLLDYAINSTLVLSSAVLRKNDKIGLLTFNHQLTDVLKASKSKGQLTKMTDMLYKQSTGYLESNYEALMHGIRYHVGQRSLVLLYTNFETTNALERHMPYLKSIARKHLLCVVIFENKELKVINDNYADSIEGIYVKTIAERFSFEKKRIAKELSKEGIISIYTTPDNLSADMVNTYLELKRKRVL